MGAHSVRGGSILKKGQALRACPCCFIVVYFLRQTCGYSALSDLLGAGMYVFGRKNERIIGTIVINPKNRTEYLTLPKFAMIFATMKYARATMAFTSAVR